MHRRTRSANRLGSFLIFPVLALGPVLGCTAIHEIEILSDPPGARIEVDSDYLGEAPLTYSFESPIGDRVWPWPSEVTAIPAERGQYVQRKVFRRMQRLPSRILFVMDLAPPRDSTRIEIDQDVNVKGEIDANVKFGESGQKSAPK